MVAIPLAVPAALLSEHWWALAPLWFCAWWWAPRDWGWEWLQSFEASLVGTEWAAIGAFSLGGFPEHRVVMGTVWIAVPMVFAIVFAQRRRP